MTVSFTSHRNIRLLVPLLLWMGVIAILSSDLGSMKHMLAIMPRFVREWIAAGFTGEGPTPEGVWGIRKLAHIVTYAVLGILAIRWVHAWAGVGRRIWLGTIVLCVLYASLDEVHQSFVPSRTASGFDVLFDLFGAVVGMILAHRLIRRAAHITE